MIYELQYLPLARQDLKNIVGYLADNLKAPEAAMDLVNALESSLLRLRQFPYSCRVYPPLEALEAECRLLPVKNYLIFYAVNEPNEVEIHRIIYAKMNLEKVLK